MSEAMEKMKAHPLWNDLEETRQIMKDIRPAAGTGDANLNERLDMLEERATDLTNRIAEDLEIFNPQRGRPLFQKSEEKWRELRKLYGKGRYEDEETIWGELREIRKQVLAEEAKENTFSDS